MIKKICKKLTLIAVIALFNWSTLFATNYYVSALTGSNNNTGLSETSAFASIQNAADLTTPGDTVFVMNGTYSDAKWATSNHVTMLYVTRSGAENAYITYKNYPGHTPKILGINARWNCVEMNASYIVIDGLNFEGNNANITLEEATQAYNDVVKKVASAGSQGRYNTNCISMGGSKHHITIKNCKVHDFSAGGIGVGAADYVNIENNIIYNNSWYTMYATSGISVLNTKSIDNVTSYKIFIRNNIVHNNKTLVPWEKIDALSDGNGIILDVNVGNGTTVAPYVGRYLVENNVSYNNGGGGIHAYKAAHVDIINNTAYNNGTVVGYPEIDANQCSDVKIYNNIMYARTGGNCNGNDANTIYDYNLYFNGPAYKKGAHDITADPQFVNLAKDATANFRLQSTSPAINNGSNTSGQFSPTDILKVARPIGFSTDMGAYEYPVVIPRAEINVKQGATEITDGTGSYDFGDVASTTPKTVSFTIENSGDFALNLTGTPKVAITGTGFSLEADAPATVPTNGNVTFQVKLTTTTIGAYTGTISIANNDANENPYNFAITGYGYDGTKVLQNITFPSLPIKVMGESDFNPGATSSTGLAITYTSSNTKVATIVNGKVHLVNAGESTITASQFGDDDTNPAKSLTQLLTVTPVLPAAGSNLITNPTFDANTTGWSFANKKSAASTVESFELAGSTSNVGKVVITSLGTTTSSDNVQLSTNVFVVKDRNYLITFRGSADAARNASVQLLMNASPWSTIYSKGVALTTTQTKFGSFAFTSTYTGSVAFRFFLGASNIVTYFDDVEIIEEPTVNVNVISANLSSEVIMFPNPATDILNVNVRTKYNEKVAISIIDLQGRVLSTKRYVATSEGINTFQFDVQTISQGNYLVKVSTLGAVTSKIIVVKR
jgi:hypothetical protein